MLNAPFALRRAGVVGTIGGRLAFVAHEGRTAFRTGLYKGHGRSQSAVAQFGGHSYNLRNDLAGFLHIDLVSQV